MSAETLQVKAPGGSTPMTDRDEIEAILDRYRTAVYTKDVDAFIGLYDEDTRVFDLWGAGCTAAVPSGASRPRSGSAPWAPSVHRPSSTTSSSRSATASLRCTPS